MRWNSKFIIIIIIIIVIIIHCEFFFFITGLVDGDALKSKSPKISGNLLSILTDLNSVVVWMVAVRAMITNPSSLLI